MGEEEWQAVENVLSTAWNGAVCLGHPQLIEEHAHVTRLTVLQAPPGTPKTVILKRWRSAEDERFDPDFSASHLFNDWASLEFLGQVFGPASPAPQFYAGDQEQGFFVIEDLQGALPLSQTFWGEDAPKATRALVRYAEVLGQLHGLTLGQSEIFNAVRKQLGDEFLPEAQNYTHFFQQSVEVLERLGFQLSPAALADVQQAAEILSQPGVFFAFTHGDPVFSNVIETLGRLRLIDFESARFRHALWEGAYPRMLFPTSGLNYVYRIPETTWRQAELVYRSVLSQHCPAAMDDTTYGLAMTAACACWALALCQGPLSLQTAIVSTAPWVNELRQRMVARLELFVLTTQEFASLEALGDGFATLLADVQSRWPAEAGELPFYPVFQTS